MYENRYNYGIVVLIALPKIKKLVFNARACSKNIFSFRKVKCEVTGAEVSKHFCARTINLDNSMWGLDGLLSEQLVCGKGVYVEHGVFFGDAILENEKREYISTIVTMSPFREKIIREKLNKNVLVIGSYIRYVKSPHLFTKKNLERYSKTKILVFGNHSTISTVQVLDYAAIIEKIKKRFFDSQIFVSLFYLDFLNENLRKSLIEMGAIPLCFGSRYDPDFMRRLHTAISSSDIVVTNNVGTHVGYCLSLKKIPILVSESARTVIANQKRKQKELNIRANPDLAVLHKQKIENVLPTLENYERKKVFDAKDEDVLNKYFGYKLKVPEDSVASSLMENKVMDIFS